MGIKDKAKKIAAATAALATSGLSSCKDGPVGDPAPPALECSTVDMGQTLTARARKDGATAVAIDIQHGLARWTEAELTALAGATLASLATGSSILEIVLELDSAATTTVTFTVEGTLTGIMGGTCPTRRSFTVSIGAGAVSIESSDHDRLALPARQQARIVLVERDGDEVELEASTPFRGARTIQWAITGGEVVRREGERLRWKLPAEAGFYQVELLLDYGDAGLSVDTLAFEVC